MTLRIYPASCRLLRRESIGLKGNQRIAAKKAPFIQFMQAVRLGTRLQRRSVTRNATNSIKIAGEMRAAPPSHSALTGPLRGTAAVADVIVGVASIERPAAHAKAVSACDCNNCRRLQSLKRHRHRH